MRFLFAVLTALLLLVSPASYADYILRYSTTDSGGILFTGNALGLSKENNQNQPGSADAIGAFTTTDTSQKVGNYLAGTTLDWHTNSSTAILDLPAGSTVLYAELVWSGSFGFNNQITGNEPNTPVTLTTPQDNSFSVVPDPITAQSVLTPGSSTGGNYTRSADVTALVQAGGGGRYIVGGIPATISAADNTHNAAGWTLAVVFQNGAMVTSNLSLFVGCEQASSTSNPPATITGFFAPPSGPLVGRLFISAIEGDANKQGDHMLFGNSLPLTIASNSLSGTNNPINNFFASQINTLLPFSGVQFVGSGQLDTRGSFGNFNANPVSGQILPGSRQGYDITSVDISAQLAYNETVAYAQGTTTGDDYTINALAMQIQVGAPIVQITKRVDDELFVRRLEDDVVTFSFVITNTGTEDATSAVFTDNLESGLVFVPDSVEINGLPALGLDPTTGIDFGTIEIDEEITISFQVSIDDYPDVGNLFYNEGLLGYEFAPPVGDPIPITNTSNPVEIQLPLLEFPVLVVAKQVNGVQAIDSSVDNVVIFTVEITNTGTAAALDVEFIDPLQVGLELVPGSVTVDGIIVNPDPDLTTGFLVGSIDIGETTTVQFQATITAPPVGDTLYRNTATVDYDRLVFNEEPEAPPVLEPMEPVDTNEVTINLAVAPVGFHGFIHRCRYINLDRYCAETFWVGAYSSDIIAYRIYIGSTLLAEVPSLQHAEKICGFARRGRIFDLTLRAVYAGNVESDPIPIEVIQ